MKTREDIREDILGIESNTILCELATGVGKSKIALDFMNEHNLHKILIVIPKLVLIENWKQEFNKWGYSNYLENTQFVTYVSLPKLINENFDLIIFDEAHHLSERARLSAESIVSKYRVLLSATVTKSIKKELKLLWPDIVTYSISIKTAIDEGVLPDPQIYLVPLDLDNTVPDQTMVVNPKAKGNAITINYSNRAMAFKDRTHKYNMMCTEFEYYTYLSLLTDKFKKLYHSTCKQSFYFMWQQKAGERLKYLSSLKNSLVLKLLKKLKNYRTLTFCSNIAQTEALGKYCINSKDKNSMEYLQKFNNGEINHITTCNILNEGVNLTNCQIGIFVSINSSEIMIKQKNGRLLRHKNPKIYIIYYKNTREEDLVNEMMLNYNPKLITIVDNINQL